MSRAIGLFLALGLGVLIGWVTDYSMSAHWGIVFRKPWMGWAGMGL